MEQENKVLRDMTLSELTALLSAVDASSERMAQMLTDYATMSKDPYLENINQQQREIYDKRMRFERLKSMINYIIDGKLSDICEVEGIK